MSVLVGNVPCTNLENATEVISGARKQGFTCSKVTENGIVRHRSQAFWPQCLGKVQSRTPASSTGLLWCPCCGMLDNLPAALLQLPSCNGDFTSLSHRGTDTEQQREPRVLFGLYRLIFLWGCSYRWDQPGFVPVMSFKEKKKSSIIFKATSFSCFYRRAV